MMITDLSEDNRGLFYEKLYKYIAFEEHDGGKSTYIFRFDNNLGAQLIHTQHLSRIELREARFSKRDCKFMELGEETVILHSTKKALSKLQSIRKRKE